MTLDLVAQPLPQRVELLLGCGHDRTKKLPSVGRDVWEGLVTLDMNPAVKPDVVHDLVEDGPLPFEDNTADELHFYDVLEHLGAQGDWRALLGQFADYWRVAKPNATLHALVPWHEGIWAWGDPGHTRVITPETLTFLDQASYIVELDGLQRTNRTDYRFFYQADWRTEFAQRIGPDGEILAFVLRAIKPTRCVPA